MQLADPCDPRTVSLYHVQALMEAGRLPEPRTADAADADAYAESVGAVLRSLEGRDRFLEKVPVADTVVVLQRLASVRGIEQPLTSRHLPQSQ